MTDCTDQTDDLGPIAMLAYWLAENLRSKTKLGQTLSLSEQSRLTDRLDDLAQQIADIQPFGGQRVVPMRALGKGPALRVIEGSLGARLR